MYIRCMEEKNREIINNLCHITVMTELHENFGEPFIKAFSKFMVHSNEATLSASYTCSLFLSVIFNKFPSEKLHTFVHFTKERYHRFSFNCNMYESIFSHINEEDLTAVVLLDKEGNTSHRACSKQDIFEAFDFYTNI